MPVLWLGTAERVSAIVEMKHPDVWVMGDLSNNDRRHGMGIVVEYLERKGPAQWVKPRRYRMRFRNASDDIHPLHLHRHTFELTRVGGKPTAGVMKDVVMLGGFQEIEFEFVANNAGLTLFHWHQQLYMDFGFMALFKYA